MKPPGALSIGSGSLIGGRYVLKRVIGRGGYGAIYEAEHATTGQGVAIKTLTPGLEGDDLALKRFFQEARVTSRLRHPNTIRVFDFGQDESGLLYIAMELLTGVTLKQELKARTAVNTVFTEREAIDIGIQVTRSLGEAHAAGLVHRDLKPDNIFLHRVAGDDPAVKVLDFGIAKLYNESLTAGGGDNGIPGTPAYMSPEQVTQAEIDGRSDLYSLGIVLYSLVSGTVPFKSPEAMHVLYSHVHHPPPDLRERARTPLSDEFLRVIERALSKDPNHRPEDARQMRFMLQSCLGEPSASVSLNLASEAVAALAENKPRSSKEAKTVRARVPPPDEGLEPTVHATPSRNLPQPALFQDAESDAGMALVRSKSALEDRFVLATPPPKLVPPHGPDTLEPSVPDVHSIPDALPPRRRLRKSVVIAALVVVLGLTAGVGFFVSHVLLQNAIALSIPSVEEAAPAEMPGTKPKEAIPDEARPDEAKPPPEEKAAPELKAAEVPAEDGLGSPSVRGGRAVPDQGPARPENEIEPHKRSGHGKHPGRGKSKKDDVLDMKI